MWGTASLSPERRIRAEMRSSVISAPAGPSVEPPAVALWYINGDETIIRSRQSGREGLPEASLELAIRSKDVLRE